MSRELVLHRLGVIDSTISWSEQHLDSFDREALTAVVAESQTAGRGRLPGRRWHSPEGVNLYLTTTFFIDKISPDHAKLAQRLMASVYESVEEFGFSPQLRWPNDLLLGGKKVAGAMADTKALAEGYAALASVGLNVNATEQQLAQVDQPATSLRIECGAPVDRELLLEEILRRIVKVF